MREIDEGAMFPKDNIAGDTKMMRDSIIIPIPFLSFVSVKALLFSWLGRNSKFFMLKFFMRDKIFYA